MQSLLLTEWLDGTVSDQITVEYSLIPLPYHLHVWEVNQLMPYFMDNCISDSSSCDMMNKYKDYSFQMQSDILSLDNLSKKEMIQRWTGLVATAFNIDQSDLELCYDRDKDIHNTEDKLRGMFKYATSVSANNIPAVFVNRVKLDTNPSSVQGWMEILNSLYESQWKQNTESRVESGDQEKEIEDVQVPEIEDDSELEMADYTEHELTNNLNLEE